MNNTSKCPVSESGVLEHHGKWWLMITDKLAATINRPEVELTEDECFMIEAAEQIAGIETIDDDARTYVVTREQIVKLMTTVRDTTREQKPVAAYLEPFHVNRFIDDELSVLLARFDGIPHWQERQFVEQNVGEFAREVALRVIMDKATLIDNLARLCHGASVAAGWWTDLHTGESLIEKQNKGELLMLMVSEIGEIMEAVRKDLPSDKLPGFTGEEEEAADLLIRLADYAGARKLRLGAAVVAKMAYNANREDHKPENRRKAGGKAF